ncbi:MAG: serine hydrolase [Candidatus Marinimicrobia bacterium]|nr:serine hydrolase [Candidatus Neomarinimicrobiota bacterium]
MQRIIRLLQGIIALALILVSLSQAQDVPLVSPESVGFSSERLDRLTNAIDHHIEQDLLAGTVVLVARDNQIAYFQAAGMQDKEQEIPIQSNTIFRIASMSKPITSVAVMMMYEEGHFRLSDPVSDFIPAFEEMQVLAAPDSGENATENIRIVPAKRSITIRHLLTHTSGLAYQWNDQVGDLYYEAGITHGLVEDTHTLSEDIPKLADQPLVHHPGEMFTYGLSVDVLGYLVEIVSGQPLDDFLRDRLFKPLGMDDTAFYVPKRKRSRLSAAYTVTDDGTLEQMGESPILQDESLLYSATYPTSRDHRFLAGGAGLTSTVPDYYRFCQMLLNGGSLDGVQILSPQTVKLMTTDHVGDLLDNNGFGLGFGVTRSLQEAGELDAVGRYYWGSFWYGTFFIDPAREIIAIALSNKHPAGDATLNQNLLTYVYQAFIQ